MSQSFHQTGGWIEVISGVMFSGKSEELIRRLRRAMIARKRVQVFKSRLDERYSGIYTISSHDGRTVDAIPADSAAQIAQQIDPTAQVVAIDEAQFLDSGILQLVTSLAARGRRVIIAGTDTDFRGEPFGPMPQLMAIAEVVDKLHAICVLCGGPASRRRIIAQRRWRSQTLFARLPTSVVSMTSADVAGHLGDAMLELTARRKVVSKDGSS